MPEETVVSTQKPDPAKWPGIFRRVWWVCMGVLIWGELQEGVLPWALMPAAERTLYFKLPIAGARFHWEFLDAAAFLSGELTLRIINKGRDQTLVVFRDGKIQDGWEMIGEPRRDGAFYFGFATSERFRTRKDDSLIVTLKTTQDLRGRGPYDEGVLKAGTWQMTGTYSSLYGGTLDPMDYLVRWGKPPVAYMQCWDGVWPITITRAEGYRGAKLVEEKKPSFLRRLSPKRGTNRHPCGSHI